MAETQLKDHIVSFRIPNEQAEVVDKMLKAQPIVGAKSVSQFFRKIGRDFLAGRVVYKNPRDLYVSTDLL